MFIERVIKMIHGDSNPGSTIPEVHGSEPQFIERVIKRVCGDSDAIVSSVYSGLLFYAADVPS